ncbi:MAG TPA: class I SAM-dependent methyltransferase [Acidobacteriota bacterium]|nr:class I SAM-dependent methyltransferase [Acidobacteriota bacterium]
MRADVWKNREVAKAFLEERSVHIPDRHRQLEVIAHVLRFTRTDLRRIVDLGAGDGIILATVLDLFPQTAGVALDFSPAMLEKARERLAQFGDRASIVEADLGSPAWRDKVSGTFDAILSGFAIHHLSHERKRALYREIYQLLSGGGVFVNLEHVSSPTPRVEEMFNEAMTNHLFTCRRQRGEDVTLEAVHKDFLERPDRAANILAPVEEQCQWLREIGFADVDCFWKYFELAVFGGFRPSRR